VGARVLCVCVICFCLFVCMRARRVACARGHGCAPLRLAKRCGVFGPSPTQGPHTLALLSSRTRGLIYPPPHAGDQPKRPRRSAGRRRGLNGHVTRGFVGARSWPGRPGARCWWTPAPGPAYPSRRKYWPTSGPTTSGPHEPKPRRGHGRQGRIQGYIR
jgi:hypothetical protein